MGIIAFQYLLNRFINLKRRILLFPFISISLLLNSCSNSTEPDNSPILLIGTPVVTGLIITSENSPEPLAIWRNPQTQAGIYYSGSGDISSKLPPGVMNIYSPYPNPTNGSTSISFTLPINTEVSVWLVKARLPEEKEKYSETLSGGVYISSANRVIRTLMNTELKSAGHYNITWDAKDDNRKNADAGFYRIYFKADGHLFWEDILLARRKTDLPTDLRYLWNH